MILTGANSQLVYQSAVASPSTVQRSCQQRHLWQPPVPSGFLPSETSLERVGSGKGNENLVYTSLWDFKRSFTCHKILRHGTSGFTSHLKEGVLRNFITLKNPPPWPGSNPQPFVPVASALTTTPPSRLAYWYY
jgi:hypothetical protein